MSFVIKGLNAAGGRCGFENTHFDGQVFSFKLEQRFFKRV
jgi:hypothetical protein